MSSASLQREHYQKHFFEKYEQHYDDPCSQRYRNEFIHEPLFAEDPLAGADVLEAMCGSGETTSYLMSRGARVTGLDLSEAAIASFSKRWPKMRGVCASITESGLPDASFDAAVVIGGLHHLHPNVEDGIREVGRILRPGGRFYFVEPHVGSLPDLARKFWYARDAYFASNEASIDVDELQQSVADIFAVDRAFHFGTFGWLLVLNSMIFRIPVGLKPLYTRPAIALERVLGPITTKALSCQAACVWVKRQPQTYGSPVI
jgi:SAM-dependent methyltransferase